MRPIVNKTLWTQRLAKVMAFLDDNMIQCGLAVLLTLAVVGWRVARFVWASPSVLIVLPFVAVVLAILAALFVSLGGAGWLVAQIIRLAVRWRAHSELREGMTKVETIGAIAGIVFLGVPEFVHAVTWWHEHVLRFLPHEEAALRWIGAWYRQHHEGILALAFTAAVGCAFLWKFFRNFRSWVRDSLAFVSGLLTRRRWTVPIALGSLMAATVALIAVHETESLEALLSVEFLTLVLWLLAPFLLPRLPWIAAGVAAIAPALIVSARFDRSGSSMIFYLAVLSWGAWLFSIAVARRGWRLAYWLGVIGVLGYLLS